MENYFIRSEPVQKILQQNIDHHGAGAEVDVAIEEMSELTKELIKHRRGRKNILAISEEIADVEIMLEQLKIIFKCHDLVADQVGIKIGRISDGLHNAGIA